MKNSTSVKKNNAPVKKTGTPIELTNWELFTPYEDSSVVEVMGNVVSDSDGRKDVHLESYEIQSAKLINPDCLSCVDNHGSEYILPVEHFGDFSFWKGTVMRAFSDCIAKRYDIPMEFIHRAWRYKTQGIAKYKREAKRVLKENEAYVAFRDGYPVYIAYMTRNSEIVPLPIDNSSGNDETGSFIDVMFDVAMYYGIEDEISGFVTKAVTDLSYKLSGESSWLEDFSIGIYTNVSSDMHTLHLDRWTDERATTGIHVRNDCSKNFKIFAGRGDRVKSEYADITCSVGTCTLIKYTDLFKN